MKNQQIIDNQNIKIILDKIIKNNFNDKYDHSWIKYIYINSAILNSEYYVYFKNNYIKIILEEELYKENVLIQLLEEIIEFIKVKNIKLNIYYLPDILNLHTDYKILYSNQKQKDISNIICYIKEIPDKVFLIDFSIKNQDITFYIKYTEYFKCNIKDIEINLMNNIFSKYREIEEKKTKILLIHDYDAYYDCNFIKYMFDKDFWIDFCSDINDDFSDIICKGNQYFLYYYYDIILTNNSSGQYFFNIYNNCVENKINYNLNFMKNKMFIIQKNYPNFDTFPPEYYDCNLPSNINKFIYYSKIKLLNEDILNNCRSRSFNCNYSHPRLITTNHVKNIEKKCIMCDLGLQKISYNNDTVLSKINFFRNYNLDINKKLVTIFIQWPQISPNDFLNKKKHSWPWYSKFEETILTNNKFILNLCSSFEKYNCNVIFKCHPWEGLCLTPGKINFNKTNKKHVDENNKNIYLLEEVNFLCKKNMFVDNTYSNEIYKYSDYCVLIGPTSVGIQTYLYDMPSLCISQKENKDYDWFLLIESYIKQYYYGIFEYYEDIIDNMDCKIENFLNINHKDNYKYFANNPFYGNTYFYDYKKLGDKIIELINNNKNIKITNKKNKSIKLLMDPSNITVYDKNNIEFNMIDNILTYKILNIPSKSHGISIKVVENYDNNKFKLSFDCKLDKKEEDIILRIYTGEKWIETNETININYKKFIIIEDFNFYKLSKWRISTTSKTIGQKIYIKSIEFTP